MKVFLSLLIIAAFAFTGCKKNNTSGPKLKTTIIPDLLNSVVDTSDYSYNSDGRVALIQNHNGSKQVFTYTGNTVSQVYYDKNGTAFQTITYFLNSKGLADSSAYASSGGQPHQYSYAYDGKQFLVKQKSFGPTKALTGISTFQNDGSNIINRYDADTSGSTNQTTHYTFFTDHNTTIDNANMGMSFLGKQFSNPINEQNVSGSFNFNNSYTYTYDSEGRIISMAIYSGGTLTSTNEYGYE